MNTLILIMSIILIEIFCYFFLFPYLNDKILLWKLSKRIKNMSKKYNGDTKEKLEKLSDELLNASKSVELFEEE